ncbi:MAG: YIP1 family protein [Ignavibacteriales bacterium]|nr:YIP1 family protein [Ignavibacteriales bacterium]
MNKIICKNCNSENALYRLNCFQCNALLRTRVVNIDLWKTIKTLIDNPFKSFREIIQSEHKNFIFAILIFIGVKFFSNVLFFSDSVYKVEVLNNYLWINMLIFSGIFFLFIFLFSLLVTFSNKLLKIKTRYKDNLSIYIYSFIPQVLVLIILLPIEFALFGKHWFTGNPEPFVIRPLASHILFILEIISIVWTFVLMFLSSYVQTKKIIYSIIISIFSIAFLSVLIIFISLYIY